MDYNIFGIIILVLDIIALFSVWASGASTGTKVLWTVVIIILPIIGLIAWFFLGPKRGQMVP
jgi:drug/metabolite transporter (DMT)-like permease